jgi:glycosyltransferase involved in cell wall biosynthesis
VTVTTQPPTGDGWTGWYRRSVTDPAFPKLVTVVVPVLDAAATLPQQLDALAWQTYSGAWEVVISDNGSTDGSADLARGWADRLPDLRIVDSSDRRGINHARNVGAAAARGDLVLLCDADDVVDSGWVAAMAEAARHCDVLGGRLDEDTLNDPLARAGRPAQPQDELPTALRFLPYAVGANCGIRTSVVRELGGFNEDYVRGAADIEFFWRAQLAGHRLCFVPDAVVQYRYRPGTKKLARQFYRYGMAEAQLYRDFGTQVPKDDLRTVLWRWRCILAETRRAVRHPSARADWARQLAYRTGRIRGSIRFRVAFF